MSKSTQHHFTYSPSLPGTATALGAATCGEGYDGGSNVQVGVVQLDTTTVPPQGGIAAQHALASSYDATDWEDIADQYDQLYQLDPNPVIALNRAIALSRGKDRSTGH